ncbi:MAG: phage protease [Sulfuricurvum sp.]|uniref:hypothetical protein n=1 Tax=Sulfuricurvum sp. TaxID=2025608 RepID=UPI0025EAD1EA|nr:hypothetical protein [Sulfuricurvum sp.]MCK9372584.1 phage protease [Sulfuricurvum sp.]
MEHWIELFRAGTHTDSSGKTQTWTEQDLDTIVAKYDPSNHEAPAVIGHPKDNAPAYAWVEGLKREGGLLLGKFKQVLPEFAEGVKSGLWKKRSIALYPDMTLRHVGFLGAQPPAIKGLKDIAFASDEECITIEFGESTEGGEDKDEKIKALQAQLEASKQNEAALETKFAEASTAAFNEEEARKKLEAQLTDIRNETRGKEREAFIDSLISQGRIVPAQRQMAIDMVSIADTVGIYTFAEGDAPATKMVEHFLSSLPKVITFGEMSDAAGDDDLSDPKAIAAKAVEFKESEAAAGRTISISQAVSHITKGANHG